MKLALYSIGFSKKNIGDILHVIRVFQEENIEIRVFRPLVDFIKEDTDLVLSSWSTIEDIKEFQADFIVSLGGDGTILSSVKYNKHNEIPVIGINLGRLGFLANVNKNEVKELVELLRSDSYYIESRSLIHLDSNIPVFGSNNFALNECSILKRDSSSMITIHSYLDGQYLNSYWCDGLIISTPTGSTAYSLSCGGPIIHPESNNFVLTPVAPHTLTVRPLVLPDNVNLSFEIEGRTDSFLCTLDSRQSFITKDYKLAISKEKFCVKLVRFNRGEFIDTIRKKLNWGQDVRNW